MLKFSDYNSQVRFHGFSKLSQPRNQIPTKRACSSTTFRNMALVPLK